MAPFIKATPFIKERPFFAPADIGKSVERTIAQFVRYSKPAIDLSCLRRTRTVQSSRKNMNFPSRTNFSDSSSEPSIDAPADALDPPPENTLPMSSSSSSSSLNCSGLDACSFSSDRKMARESVVRTSTAPRSTLRSGTAPGIRKTLTLTSWVGAVARSDSRCRVSERGAAPKTSPNRSTETGAASSSPRSFNSSRRHVLQRRGQSMPSACCSASNFRASPSWARPTSL